VEECEPLPLVRLVHDDAAVGVEVWWRKLNLKARFESGPSYVSFKSVDPGGFNMGLIGSTCTALPRSDSRSVSRSSTPSVMYLMTVSGPVQSSKQGLTLVHFSAQRERFLWDMGCV